MVKDSKIRNKAMMPFLPLILNIILDALATEAMHEKEIKEKMLERKK